VNNWENFFEEIRDISKLAEESRKVYDHYEKKLEKLEDKKIEMLKEGKFNESCSFFKIIVRNEDKYMKSKEDYINKAITTYDAIERLNTDMYFVVSPVLLSVRYKYNVVI
jgi:dTDP-4-amino-4,6-dideoxygalactose transaminase